MSPKFEELARQAAELQADMKLLLPRIAEARRRYARSRTDEAFAEMREVEKEAAAQDQKMKQHLSKMQAAAGLSDEDVATLEAQDRRGDERPRIKRKELTADSIEPTGASIEDLLGAAVESLRAMTPAGRLKEVDAGGFGIDSWAFTEPLSLVRGLRSGSEFPVAHRFAQSIAVAEAFLKSDFAYDHFAGSILVPQIARLGERLKVLREIKGAPRELRRLWNGPSGEVDSKVFELLVAAGCAVEGRDIEFHGTGQEPTPDLRCHDPFPLVIECKRKRSLSQYELDEERRMKGIYARLESEVRKTGQWGRYSLELSVEVESAPVDEIVACLLRQRLSPRPAEPLAYEWGRVAFVELPARVGIASTRLYSPLMLEQVFGWNSDLPNWDGLICRVDTGQELSLNGVEHPLALCWAATTEQAITKRTWSPLTLFREAVSQVPPGEFGLVYVASSEGARRAIADRRTDIAMEQLKDMEHRASVRVPLCFLIRLYPRAERDGEPDLIESTINFVASYAEPGLLKRFPSTVFTTPT